MILENPISLKSLKNMKLSEFNALAAEIRRKMISAISGNGGHLGSSLGAVELAIAIHYVFDSPNDKIIWDVGHQAYAHKILTGRDISNIRSDNGLSGFPKIDESEHDAFGVGHASTSISAAVGISVGMYLNNNSNKVIAVIGDGSMTGGLAYEGINNLKSNPEASKKLIIILNDNGMSISRNVGGLSSVLSRKFSGSFYNRSKSLIKQILNDKTIKLLKKIKHVMKNILLPGEFFESLGLRYYGVIDGHNIKELVEVFSNISKTKQDGPVLIHVKTQKGKGYRFAETSPVDFHGVPKFNSETGIFDLGKCEKISFTKCFSSAICEIAKNNLKVTAVTAAMTNGTGLEEFLKKFPERFYDVGIAEGHAVTFAAGLATQGFIPVVAIYSSFLQRSFDQIIHDVCLQNLPVIFCVDRAGIVGEDGPTHHGAFDLSFLRIIPNIVLMAPANGSELKNMLYSAIEYNRPVAIRYPRDEVLACDLEKDFKKIPLGELRNIFNGNINDANVKVLLISCGSLSNVSLEVAKFLFSEGVSVNAVDIRFIKPLPEKIFSLIQSSDIVFTIEENAVLGGMGSSILERLSYDSSDLIKKIKMIGLNDIFIKHGSREALLNQQGLDEQSILKKVFFEIIDTLSVKQTIDRDIKNRFLEISANKIYEKRAH